MRFATRVLVLQLATVVAVVVVCAGVFVLLAAQQLRAEAEASALNIARTIAANPEVRARVAEFSADPGTPDAADLRDGELQVLAGEVTASTDVLFVVITDDHGIRLAHPEPDRLGQQVSTSFADAIAGREVVTWEVGTLGESARAKVPVWPLDDGPPVGEVSVGFERGSVFDELPAIVGGIAVAALGALLLGLLASLLLRRRWERLTLGLQPEELVGLVQNRAAVLDGVGDGVLALDPDGVVRLCNAAAERMLGLDDPVGRRFDELGLSADVQATTRDGIAREGVVVGDRVLYLDMKPVRRGERSLGDVVVVRDRTDVEALAERLDTVRSMSDALRVQRHEFANRLHVAAGLLDAQRVPDARAFLGELLQRGPVDFAVEGLDAVSDPFLQALLGAKGLAARERGVTLRIADDSLLLGVIGEAEDVAAVLGNLVDNAVVAAAASGRRPAWVEVTVLSDDDTLVLSVADSGDGIESGRDPFVRAESGSRPNDDAVHGRGFGLPLSRDLARRRGGDVWVIDAGGLEHGAVFGARLPGVVRLVPSEGGS